MTLLPASCPHRWTVDGINIVCGNGCGTALYMGYTERDTTPKFGPDGRQTWDHIELHAKNLAHALAETLNASAASTTTDAQRPSLEVELDSLRGRVAVLEAALRDADEATAEVRRATYMEIATGEGKVVAVQIPIAEWEAVRAVLAGGDAAPKMRCARCGEVTTAEWRESGWAASHRCCGDAAAEEKP